MLDPRRVRGGRRRASDVRLTADAINQRLLTLQVTEPPPPRERSQTATLVAETLGRAIVQARTRAKLKQEDVALKLSLDRSAIARWEQGERIPTILHLIAFSDLVGVSVLDLLRTVEAALRQDPFTPSQEDNDAADD